MVGVKVLERSLSFWWGTLLHGDDLLHPPHVLVHMRGRAIAVVHVCAVSAAAVLCVARARAALR